MKEFQHYLKSVGIVFCAFIIFYSLSFQISQSLKVPSYGAWGIYHYYIGGKYLKELGYFNIYSCTLEVNKNSWQTIAKVRDLKTYKIVRIPEISKCPTNSFSKEQWNEFSNDIKLITNNAPTNYWENSLSDKGFNATPFWAALSGVVAYFIPLNSSTYLFLFNLDILFVIVTSLILWRYTGKFVGVITLTLSLLYFGTLNIIGGNFLQYAWLPLLAASFVLWNKKSYKKSGVVLGLATGLQAFPVFFALPVLFTFIIALIKKRAKEIKPPFSFLKTFIATLLICFIVGSIYGGISSWTQWSEKISIQKNYINGEIFNIGFPNLVATTLSNDHTSSDTYPKDWGHTINRVKALQKNSIPFFVTTIVLVLSIFFVMIRKETNHPMQYGFFVMYLLSTLSPYYYLTLVLLPFVFWNNSPPVKRLALWGTVGLFLIHLLIFPMGYVMFDYQKHLFSEVLIFTFFGILIFLLFFEKKNK